MSYHHPLRRHKLRYLRDWKVKEIPPASVADELSFDHPLFFIFRLEYQVPQGTNCPFPPRENAYITYGFLRT